MPEQKCINCGENASGSYCSYCGQPVKPSRLTWKSFWTDFVDRIYSIDSKFLRTLIELTIKPGMVALKFIRGNRVLYVQPISYFLITITFLILYMQLIDLDYAETINETQKLINPDAGEKEIQIQQFFNQKITEYLRTFSFLQIPFVAFAARMFYKKPHLLSLNIACWHCMFMDI